MKRIAYGLILGTIWCGANAQANLMDGDFDGSILPAMSWTAGTDTAGVWYGADYTTANGFAELMFEGSGKRSAAMESERRSVLQALPIPEAGQYKWDLWATLSKSKKQDSYWQAFLVKKGTKISLVGGPAYDDEMEGATKLLSADSSMANKDRGKWFHYVNHFQISAEDARDYNFVAFVLTGSRHAGGVLGYDRVSTNVPGGSDDVEVNCENPDVPEPVTAMLLVLGSLGVLGAGRRSRRGV